MTTGPPGQVPNWPEPSRLLAALETTGWRIVGGRTGQYVRLAQSVDETSRRLHRWSLLVPVDPTAPDYSELMAMTIGELSSPGLAETWNRSILPRLQATPTDEFMFRKESSAPTGLISWRDGEDLIGSARATLTAGAKAHLGILKRYSNRFGRFASRYLDSIFMGQTAIGSYVVTAYAPTHAAILLGSSVVDLPSQSSHVDSRDVTITVAKALEATNEALNHYRSTGSMTAFETALNRGASYDLLVALEGVARDADEGDITISWSGDQQDDPSPSTVMEFRGNDAAVLERASRQFAVDDEAALVSVVGRVKYLTKKEAGDPGVFGVQTITGPTRTLRVRLADSNQYHEAVRAHDEDRAIRVVGDLERDGSLFWVYNAHIDSVLGSIAETINELRGSMSHGILSLMDNEEIRIRRESAEDGNESQDGLF